MIPQPIGPLLGPLDCENIRDFSQYYNRRYFAIKSDLLLGSNAPEDALYPAMYSGGTNNIALIFWMPNKGQGTLATTWDSLRVFGRFGHALLGTIPWKHSYAYLSQYAYRESVKGFGPNRVYSWVPGELNSKVVFAYKVKHPEAHLPFVYKTGPQIEMEAVYEIYNKRMYTWEEAIENLVCGRKLGCNISNKMGLFIQEGEPEIQVSYKDKVIGIVKPFLNELHLRYEWHFLRQVVQEQIPRNIGVF